MTTIAPPRACMGCIHWRGPKKEAYRPGVGHFVCKAFPNAIPDEIANDEHWHRTPYPGDNGIQFETTLDYQITPAPGAKVKGL